MNEFLIITITATLSIFIGAIIVYIFFIKIIKKYKNLSLTDELTGLYNIREFKLRFSAEISRCKRYKLPFSILLLDIDKFKSINDKFGYKTGDKLLCDIVAVLKKQLRESDLLFRYKLGDEFIIMAINTNKTGAKNLAQRIQKNISQYEFLIGNKNIKKQISISIGISEFEIANPEKNMEIEAEVELKKAKKPTLA